jgi:hypothetical protein
MAALEDVLISVWRQVIIDPSVKIDGDTYPVKSTARRGLKQTDLRFGGKSLRAVEGRRQKENVICTDCSGRAVATP